MINLGKVVNVCLIGALCSCKPNVKYYSKSDNLLKNVKTRLIHTPLEKIVVKNQHTYVLANNKYFEVPNDTLINTYKPYNGIYTVQHESIQTQFSTLKGNKLLFVLYDDVGTGYRGHLFAFDLKKHIFTNDPFNKSDYLYSSAGVFFIKGDTLLSVSKPVWHEKADRWITPASYYIIENTNFRYLKSAYILGEANVGEATESHTAIINFYKKIVAHKKILHSFR